MNLSLSTEDLLLADSALRWLRADRSSTAARWREFANLGWLALPIAEDSGGLGASDATLAVLIEQLGYACCESPYQPVVVVAAGLLGRVPGATAQSLLAGIAGGEDLVVVAEASELRAECSATSWTLSGSAPLVLGGDVATQFLLPGRAPDGVLRLFLVARETPGLGVTPVQALGPCNAADLALDSVAAQVLGDPVPNAPDMTELLDWNRDRSTALACADAVGAIHWLVETTVAYTSTRVQFKKPLAEFQVIEHYRADLLTWREEARAAAQLAVAALGADADFRARAVSAAKVKVGDAARRVAQQSIQMHGAMGVTEELAVGRYAKRLLAFDALWGSRDAHVNRYATLACSEGGRGGMDRTSRAGDVSSLAGSGCASGAGDVSAAARGAGDVSAGADMDGYLARATRGSGAPALSLDEAARDFRDRVRAFLRESLLESLCVAQQLTTTVYPEADVAGQWHRILHAQGWSAAHWPRDYGGTGWSVEQRYIWAHESTAAGAPIISPIGLSLVGPVLMHFGTPAQRSRYLPAIVSGEELWCQGFSEPGAGSDLAALGTRAQRDGEHYVVNGTKIWTTHGHFAHFMAALVRTDPSGGRREGISFLLIDMRSPGITIRPIVTIGGDHELNQVFFDDVRVPLANLVGNEGQGWDIAKFMLEYERGGDIMSAGHRRLLAEIRSLARSRPLEDASAFWRAYAEVAIDIDVLEMLELRTLLGCDTPSPAAASMLKLRASELQQSVTELGVRLLGREALRWQSSRPLYALPEARGEDALVSRYLNSRANTIFGGSREIQKTLIARAASVS